MPFTAEPLIPGDLYEGAARLAREAGQEVLRLAGPAARAVAMERRWKDITALGWPALFIPEAQGGAGGAMEDLVALIDGATRDALALPLVAVCGLVPVLLQALEPSVATDVVAGIVDGTSTLCPVLDAFSGWLRHDASPAATIMPDGSIGLAGFAIGVELPPGSSHFLLACPVTDAHGGVLPGLLLVPADRLPQSPRRFERLDGRVSADVSFAGVTLPATALLACGDSVAAQVRAAMELGAFLSCVETASALGAVLELLIAFLLERRQFGVALSTFQALRHKVAELYVVYETVRALVVRLLRVAGPGGALPSRDVALAKLHLGGAARQAAETVIQLHGGMGMTQELPASRLNKRLLMVEFEYGDAVWHGSQLLQAA